MTAPRNPFHLGDTPGLILLVALSALIGARLLSEGSAASFTSHSANTANHVAAADVASWLTLDSQASRPAGCSHYAQQAQSSPSLPAASGLSDSLAVNLGTVTNQKLTFVCVFSKSTPASFPESLSNVSVTLSATADQSTGIQPLSDYYFADDADNYLGRSTNEPPGTTGHVDVVVNTRHLSGTYIPHLIISVTYAGFSGGFLSYQIPVTVAT